MNRSESGSRGGKAAARKMTAHQRSKRAKKVALARPTKVQVENELKREMVLALNMLYGERNVAAQTFAECLKRVHEQGLHLLVIRTTDGSLDVEFVK